MLLAPVTVSYSTGGGGASLVLRENVSSHRGALSGSANLYVLLANGNYVNSSPLLERLEADGSSVQLRATALNPSQSKL